jgi:hypothetical protein
VTNGFPIGRPLSYRFTLVNCVQTLQDLTRPRNEEEEEEGFDESEDRASHHVYGARKSIACASSYHVSGSKSDHVRCAFST